MAQVRSDNILADLPKILDDKMGVAGNNPAWRPYNNVAEFVTRFSAPSTTNLAGAGEGQFFWVRSQSDANKADLYIVNKDKSTSKLLVDYYLKTEVDALILAESVARDDDVEELLQDIVNSTLKKSVQVNTTTGAFTQEIPGTSDEYILQVFRSGTGVTYTVDYSNDAIPSDEDKTVTFDPLTEVFTFPTQFYDNEFVYAMFQGTTGGTTMNVVVTVATYADMLNVAIGNRVLTIFVTEESAYNEEGDFFVYYPTKGIAYLGIDFNYTD